MIAAILGLATIVAYACAVRAYDRRYPQRRYSALRLGSFTIGVALMTACVLPPFDALADLSFAAHMTQHLILTLIGPPLVLLGAPLLLVVALPAPDIGKAVARVVRHPIVLALSSPVPALLLFTATLWTVHFSPLYDLALRNEAVHAGEHALLVVVAFLFWLPVVQVGYAPRPVAFPARMLYLFLAIPQGAFLGLTIFSSRYVLYAHYAIGRSPAAALADQQNAGAVMWIGGGAIVFVAFMITAAVWAAHERVEGGEPYPARNSG
ncbi:MAG TPA: cytochrome c oxidase assembly protein [Candidatus Baltobacteraceae bacterium]